MFYKKNGIFLYILFIYTYLFNIDNSSFLKQKKIKIKTKKSFFTTKLSLSLVDIAECEELVELFVSLVVFTLKKKRRNKTVKIKIFVVNFE